MAQFQMTKRSKTIHQVMKSFKVVPYEEVEKTLDEASKKAFADKKCEKFDMAKA
jgi:hypothetical protein